jgi:hypothetical protein
MSDHASAVQASKQGRSAELDTCFGLPWLSNLVVDYMVEKLKELTDGRTEDEIQGFVSGDVATEVLEKNARKRKKLVSEIMIICYS